MDNPRSRQSHAAKAAVNGMIVVGAATRVITRKVSRTAGTWCASTHFLIGSSNGAVSLLKTSSPIFAQAAIAAVETPISRTVCDSSPRGRRRGRCAITGYVGTSSGQRPFSCQSLSRAKTAAHCQLSRKSFSRTRHRTCCPSTQIHRPVTWPLSSPLVWSRSQGRPDPDARDGRFSARRPPGRCSISQQRWRSHGAHQPRSPRYCRGPSPWRGHARELAETR
jgi:hypothetical protein